MKKIIAREFLWFWITLVAAAPLAFLFLVCLDLVAKKNEFSEGEKIFVVELFLLAYIINFFGVYLIRLIVLAIKTISQNAQTE